MSITYAIHAFDRKVYAVIDTQSKGFVGKEHEGACAWCVRALLEHDAWRV